MTYTGGCLCGLIRYEAKAPPFLASHCHCGNCKKHTGAAFATDALFHAKDFAWTDKEPTYYASSDICERSFCPKCGSTVSARYATEPGILVIAAGSLDDPDQIEPQVHAFTSRRASWIKLDDGLPEYPEAEPMSGIDV